MTNRLELLLQLAANSPDDAFTLFALAKEYEKADMPAEALTYYRRLRDKEPTYVGLYYHLAKLHENAGETDLALEVYAQGMEVAREARDRHALSELSNARMNLEMNLM
jgi:tetratricopeptide (TPR) repeat protein